MQDIDKLMGFFYFFLFGALPTLTLFQLGKFFDTDEFSPFFGLACLWLPFMGIGIILYFIFKGICQSLF